MKGSTLRFERFKGNPGSARPVLDLRLTASAKDVGADVIRRIAQALRSGTGDGIRVRRMGGPSRNPSLAFHKGLRASHHLVADDASRGPIADLYGVGDVTAQRIGQKIADVLKLRVRLLSNAGAPFDLESHTVTGTAEPTRRRRNPSGTPAAGQLWGRLGGGTSRVIEIAGPRVHVLDMSTGKRDWLMLTDFRATHRAPQRRNPARGAGARAGRKAKRTAYKSRRILRAADARARAVRAGGSGKSELARFTARMESRRARVGRRATNPKLSPVAKGVAKLVTALGFSAVADDIRSGRHTARESVQYLLSPANRLIPESRKMILRATLDMLDREERGIPAGMTPADLAALKAGARGKAAAERRKPNPKRPRGWPVPIGGGWDVVTARAKAGSIASGETTEQDWRQWYKAATGLEPPAPRKRAAAKRPRGAAARSVRPLSRRGNPGFGTQAQEAAVNRLARYAAEYGLQPVTAGFLSHGAIHVDYRDPAKRGAMRAVILPDGTVQGTQRLEEANVIMLERDATASNPKRRRAAGGGNAIAKAYMAGLVTSDQLIAATQDPKRLAALEATAIKRLGGRRRSAGRRTPRRNPRPFSDERERAERMFEKWHEFPAEFIKRVKVPHRKLPKYAVGLGKVVRIDYISNKWEGKPVTYTHSTKRPYPELVSDPDGRQLYLVGGRMKPTADGLVN